MLSAFSVQHLSRHFGFTLGRTTRLVANNYIKLGDLTAFEKVDASTTSKVVLYFTAVWCPPCRKIAPVYESLSAVHPDVIFTKVDIDILPEAAEKYSVRSVPTFVFKDQGKVIAQFSGADENILHSHLADLKATA